MTCSPRRGTRRARLRTGSAERGKGGADLNGSPAVRLGRAVLGERALHFALSAMNAHASRHACHERLRRTEYVGAAGGRQDARWRAESALHAFNRREHRGFRVSGEEQLRRCPRRQVENVLERPPFLNAHGEVWRTLEESQTGRRPGQRGANARERSGRRLLCARRGDRSSDQQTHEPRGTQAHTVRTLPRRVQPVEPVEHIRWGGR